MGKRISDEKGLKLLKENIKRIGHVPTKKEWQQNKLKPDYSWYSKRFKNFNNALIKIGINIINTSGIMQLTKEDLIKILDDKYKKLGKSPTIKDIHNPSCEVYYRRFNTHSWNKILEEAKLPLNHKEHTYKEAVKIYKGYFYKYGRVPTKKELKNEKFGESWIYTHNMSIKEFYSKIGLIDKPLTKKERINISINELKELANKLNRCPSIKEYESIKHKGYRRRNLEDNLSLKYNDICKKYIPQYKLNSVKDTTKQDVYNSINKMVKNFGYVLPYADYMKLEYSYSYNVFLRLFNLTYGQVIKSMGYKMFGTTTIKKTEEEMLEDFQNLFNSMKRIPYTHEISNKNNMADYETYIKYFGSIGNICSLLNIDYTQYYKKTGAGVICYDNNGDMCNSIPEKNITNFFIKNNIKYKKEVHYKDLGLGFTDNRRLDWVIEYKNKKYYLEYFGMYNKRGYIGKKYHKKTRKKIKDLYKKGIINQCIFIFPNDIKKDKNDNSMDWLEQKLKSFFIQKNIFIGNDVKINNK